MRHPITLFGSSEARPGEPLYREAFELGKLLGASGYDLVNGGYGGIMEASGLGAKREGARVTGVTVACYGAAKDYVDVEEPTSNFWERTRCMLEMGSGFVAVSGGTGTLAEVACAWEALHKRHLERKPLALLGSFWKPLAGMMCPRVDSKAWCTGAVRLVQTPSEAVRFLDEFLGRTAIA